MRGLDFDRFVSTGLHPWLYAGYPLRGLKAKKVASRSSLDFEEVFEVQEKIRSPASRFLEKFVKL